MDSWDPAFLEALAAEGIEAIVFDHSGLGLSSGERTYNPMDMVDDLLDLTEALGLRRCAIGGWSLGGMVAQAALTQLPAAPSHLVLLGTAPPGPSVRLSDPLFYDLVVRDEETGT
jgi:pimeloyl-ACP methyl ester carboxylesterase